MDQYSVVSADGKEYGPIDLNGLLQWVREGRVLRATSIRKNDAAPVPAETLPELAATFAQPPPAQATMPPIATVVALPAEFRIWEFIGLAWELVKPHWLPLAAMFLIVMVIGLIPYAGGCVLFVIGGALYVGLNRAVLGLLAGRPPTVEMLFSGFDRFGQAFLATLVMSILVTIGIVLCIIPGLILTVLWMFVMPILAETDLDFWSAMQASVKLTEGYRWPLFGLLLACVLVGILGLLACCVGILIAEPVIFTAIALAYRFLQAKQAVRTA